MRNSTADAIKEAFMRLLNKKPFDKITVKEIVEECGINRNTFYYHYEDIYDLLQSVLDDEVEKAMKTVNGFTNWENGFLKAAQFALENKQAIYHVYRSVERDVLEKYLYSVAELVMRSAITQQTVDLEPNETDLELMVSFYKYALSGLVIDWISHGMKDSPESNILRLGELLNGNIRYTFVKMKNQQGKNAGYD